MITTILQTQPCFNSTQSLNSRLNSERSYRDAVVSRSQAFRLGMYGGEYAWLVAGAPPRIRGAAPCSRAQLARALEGLVSVTAHRGIVGDVVSYSGLVSSYLMIYYLFFLLLYYSLL